MTTGGYSTQLGRLDYNNVFVKRSFLPIENNINIAHCPFSTANKAKVARSGRVYSVTAESAVMHLSTVVATSLQYKHLKPIDLYLLFWIIKYSYFLAE